MDQKLVDALNIIKPPFNVNEVAQKAAVSLLKITNLYLAQLITIFFTQKN